MGKVIAFLAAVLFVLALACPLYFKAKSFESRVQEREAELLIEAEALSRMIHRGSGPVTFTLED